MDSIAPSSSNPVVEAPPSVPPSTPALANISLSPLQVEVNMQKLIGVIFVRLNGIEQSFKTRMDALEKRLDGLEAALKKTT